MVSSEKYKYGVVVLNYKDYMLTISCVESLVSLGKEILVVVVDNNSQNGSYERINKHFAVNQNIIVLESLENHGYAAGNNLGIRYILDEYPTIKYLCVMNPDVVVKTIEVFNKLRHSLQADSKLAAVSPLMNLNGIITPENCGWYIPTSTEVFTQHFVLNESKKRKIILPTKGICKCEAIPGSFFMVKKSVLELIGLLDEGTFLYNEENIMGIKIKRIGMYCGVCVECDYLHNHKVKEKRDSLKQVIKNYRFGNQSRLYLSRSFYPKWVTPMVVIISVVNTPIIVLRHLLGNIKRRIQGIKSK